MATHAMLRIDAGAMPSLLTLVIVLLFTIYAIEAFKTHHRRLRRNRVHHTWQVHSCGDVRLYGNRPDGHASRLF
jgi:hypothetical protein